MTELPNPPEEQELKAQRLPSNAVGLLLNMLLPGLGFTYLGILRWNFAWSASLVMVGLWLISDPSPLLGGLTFALYVSCQLHYAVFFEKSHIRSTPLDVLAVVMMALIMLVFGVFPLAAAWDLLSHNNMNTYVATSGCAMDLSQKEAMYFIDHQRYAALNQLVGEYASSRCEEQVVYVELQQATSQTYNMVVLNNSGDYAYSVTPERLKLVRGEPNGR